MHPLISIAMCTYNGACHLREQLDSLLAQDWPALEIVVVDDASTDDTPAILSAYAQRDPRIRFSRNAVNLGYLKNFEAAMSLCQGRWIAPCDQDDIWLPTKLSRLARELASDDVLLAYADSSLMDEQGRSMHQRMSDRLNRFSTNDPLPYLLGNNATGHAMLVCRSVVERALPFPQGAYHDHWLAYAAVSSGRIAYVDECLVRYRLHASTVSDFTGQRTVKKGRAAGYRWRELAETRERLALFAAVPGKGQTLAQELLALWQSRETQFISPALTRFAWRHRDRLYAFHKDSALKRMKRPLQLLWGLRTKQLFSPHRYAKPS